MEVLYVVAGIALFAAAMWLFFVIPAQMAEDRGRSQLGWVLISLFFSPFVAIIGLLVLGPAHDRRRVATTLEHRPRPEPQEHKLPLYDDLERRLHKNCRTSPKR